MICQESAAFASGYLGLAIFGCAALTSNGHIGQSRGEKENQKTKNKTSLSKDELHPMSHMTEGWIPWLSGGSQALHPHLKCLKQQRGK